MTLDLSTFVDSWLYCFFGGIIEIKQGINGAKRGIIPFNVGLFSEEVYLATKSWVLPPLIRAGSSFSSISLKMYTFVLSNAPCLIYFLLSSLHKLLHHLVTHGTDVFFAYDSFFIYNKSGWDRYGFVQIADFAFSI